MEDATTADTKHAEMLQNVIGRMAGNSFLAKGWSVTIAAAVVGLAAKDGNPGFLWVGLLPVGMFWLVDAYYLALEQAFRNLYRAAAERIRKSQAATYDMAVDLGLGDTLAALFRPATLIVHAPLLAALLIATFVLRK